jgi:DNA-binding NarL/FixJ family response regulator
MKPELDGRTRVLVVDDNLEACGFLTRALNGEAMSVHATHSGGAALDVLDGFAPDAVLLDVDMPGMDGFATCEAMMDRHADLPVIFMTGLGDTGHIVRGFEVGACDYVTKPVAIAEVIARVRSHAAKARLARSAREAVLSSPVAMLACGNAGDLVWMNASANALMERQGLAVPRPGEHLPQAVAGALPLLRDEAAPDSVIRAGLKLRRMTTASASVIVLELEELALMSADMEALAALSTLASAGTASLRVAPTLTPREAEVMIWVARGKTNRDVADILGMSPRTVNKHLEHIYEKLGVETRTAAVAAAQRDG